MAFYFLFSCLFPLLNAFQTYGLPLPSKPCATFTSMHRKRVADGINLNYNIGCYYYHKKQTM